MPVKYDVLVIGSGTAGQTAAHELRAAGLKVGLVEHSERPGGTCALTGCQPKKWFYEAAALVARARHLEGKGITTAAVARWQDLRDAKNEFTAHVPADTVKRLQKAGIDYIEGRARFRNERSITVNGQPLTAQYTVLATGAVPMPLPFDNESRALTSDRFMELQRLARRIIFVGGGFIAFEFAHFAARLGPPDTRCTILEAAARPLGPFDEEMVALLIDASSEEGIDIHCDTEITAIAPSGRGYAVLTADGRSFEADLVVNGAGRVAAIFDLDLEKADVAHSQKGVTVDRHMATSNPHVYAVGDCTATVQLARVADAEASVAAANIIRALDGQAADQVISYRTVPSVLFTYPQYGMVGATEADLQAQGIAYEKAFAKHLSWPTYRRVGLTSAAYKILADERGALLGAHVLADDAAGIINTFTLAMANRIPLGDLYRQSVLTPYPSRQSDILYMLKPFVAQGG